MKHTIVNLSANPSSTKVISGTKNGITLPTSLKSKMTDYYHMLKLQAYKTTTCRVLSICNLKLTKYNELLLTRFIHEQQELERVVISYSEFSETFLSQLFVKDTIEDIHCFDNEYALLFVSNRKRIKSLIGINILYLSTILDLFPCLDVIHCYTYPKCFNQVEKNKILNSLIYREKIPEINIETNHSYSLQFYCLLESKRILYWMGYYDQVLLFLIEYERIVKGQENQNNNLNDYFNNELHDIHVLMYCMCPFLYSNNTV